MSKMRHVFSGRQIVIIAILLLLSAVSATARSTTAAASDTQLDVLQYNVQFLTPWDFGTFPGHWPNVESRAVAIGQAIACYDIVTLNESVNNTRRSQIIRAMEAAAPNCGKPSNFSNGYFDVVDGPDLPDGFRIFTPDDFGDLINNNGVALIDDEVSIVTRLPIIGVHFHTYEARSGLDGFAAKGVVHARLWRGGSAPASDAVDVFATHLQAGDDSVQRAQLEELTEFMRRHVEPGIPVLLLGDLNIDGRPVDYDSQGNPIFGEKYTYMVDLFEELGLVDIGVHLGGTNEDPDPSKHRQQRIDHIFVSSTGFEYSEAGIRVEEFPDSRYGTLSDHAAVEASISWQAKDPVPMPNLENPKRLSIEITELQALSSDSCNVFMDFYGELELDDGASRITEDFGVHEGNHIGPDWRITKEIQPLVQRVTSTIEVKDEDSESLVDPCGGGDDTVDVNPLNDETHVPLLIDLVNHRVYLTNSEGETIRYLAPLNRPIFLQGSNGDEKAQMVVVVTAQELGAPEPPPEVDLRRDIRVTVERLTATSEEFCDTMEFYGHVDIKEGAFASVSFGIQNGADILPNWVTETMPAIGATSIAVNISIREEDDLACGQEDDDVDVNPDPAQKSVNMIVDLVSGEVRMTDGSLIGLVNGSSIVLQGYDGNETARMTFRIDVNESTAPLPLPVDRNRYAVLTVNRLLALQSDGCGGMDFYAREIRLENGAFASENFGVIDGDEIYPGWSVMSRVEAGVTSFDAFVNIDEEDGGFCGDDDNVDVNPVTDERDLRFRTYLNSNELKLIDVAGNVSVAPEYPEVIGVVGKPVTLRGTQEDEKAQITYQVDLVLYCAAFPTDPTCLIPSLVANVDHLRFTESNADKGLELSIANRNEPVIAQWSASASEPWVRFSRTTGRTPGKLTVSIDRSRLPGGVHQAVISFTSSPPGSVLEIPLTVDLPVDRVISGVDTLVFEPSHDTSSLIVPLVNRNAPHSIAWSATTSEPWIHLGQTSGSTPHELIVSVDGTGLAAGTYEGAITVTYGEDRNQFTGTEDASAESIEIPVEMRISPNGLVLSTSEIFFNTHAAITKTAVTVGNLNRLASVSWQAVSDQPWLHVSAAAGSTPSEVAVWFESIELMSEGEYTGTITFSSPQVPNETVVLQVTAVVEYFNLFQSMTGNNPGPDLIVEAFEIDEDDNLNINIKNVGSFPLSLPFWVDLYVDPEPVPDGPNDIWADGRSRYGLVWHVNQTIKSGETITLSIGDSSFRPELSRIPGSLLAGMPIFVQVDSANTETYYGGVHEMHETIGSGAAYNNIAAFDLAATVSFIPTDRTTEQFEAHDDELLPLRP